MGRRTPPAYDKTRVERYVKAKKPKTTSKPTKANAPYERDWATTRAFVGEHPRTRTEVLASLRSKAEAATVGWDAAVLIIAVGAALVAVETASPATAEVLGGVGVATAVTIVAFGGLALTVIVLMTAARGVRHWLETLESALEDAARNPRSWR
ncbi:MULTISPECIES: hypothetical protein [unclassified Curtobacterium]|uniref:hypothetical protein n=1 Tax=unclassified Curtobacterium TaxID=257496 RepID=UPI0037FA6F79